MQQVALALATSCCRDFLTYREQVTVRITMSHHAYQRHDALATAAMQYKRLQIASFLGLYQQDTDATYS